MDPTLMHFSQIESLLQKSHSILLADLYCQSKVTFFHLKTETEQVDQVIILLIFVWNVPGSDVGQDASCLDFPFLGPSGRWSDGT
jgi:hypothetical protein